ncbi:MAG: hypothetical protein MZV63_05715 [Marinilabiliales bacterium]|nr:hypothetical protein [Marinilabiliales bacterium]
MAKYNEIEEKEVRYEEFLTDDAEYLFVAYGTSARICQKAIQLARAEGIKGRSAQTDHPVPLSRKRG